jgi:ribonuclease HII
LVPSRKTLSQTLAAVSAGSVVAKSTRNQSVANSDTSQPIAFRRGGADG